MRPRSKAEGHRTNCSFQGLTRQSTKIIIDAGGMGNEKVKQSGFPME